MAIRMELFWAYCGLLSDHGGKNHIFLWSQLERNSHLCCPDEYLATKGHGAFVSGGQGAHGNTPKARNSGSYMCDHPKVPI